VTYREHLESYYCDEGPVQLDDLKPFFTSDLQGWLCGKEHSPNMFKSEVTSIEDMRRHIKRWHKVPGFRTWDDHQLTMKMWSSKLMADLQRPSFFQRFASDAPN